MFNRAQGRNPERRDGKFLESAELNRLRAYPRPLHYLYILEDASQGAQQLVLHLVVETESIKGRDSGSSG